MKSLKTPSRPAPSVDEARYSKTTGNVPKSMRNNSTQKKKPPPRPPPPKFNKTRSPVATNENLLLMDFSPPSSPIPKVKATSAFGGSCSSSGSFSTSSISSKCSIESDALPPSGNILTPLLVPTIIRAQPSKHNSKFGIVDPSTSCRRGRSESPPMPTTKPPCPPPYGIVLYDYMGTHLDDLTLQADDIVFLTRKISDEWYYGKVDDREGMFPANYIDVQVPLPPEGGNIVKAIHTFPAETPYDLPLTPGQNVSILYRINEDWLYGESAGKRGQFPASFVDHIPSGL